MPVLLRQVLSKPLESVVGIYCFAFQYQPLLCLMTGHRFAVEESHPLTLNQLEWSYLKLSL